MLLLKALRGAYANIMRDDHLTSSENNIVSLMSMSLACCPSRHIYVSKKTLRFCFIDLNDF